MNTERARALRRFLTTNGWQDAVAAPLAGDASNRRYLRLSDGDRSAIVMDVPGGTEPLDPFVAMTDWLRRCNFSAPEILAADQTDGFLLLEDLGDDLYSSWIARRPTDESLLYARAVDLLVDVADRPVPETIGEVPFRIAVPPYDGTALEREASLVPEWWMPAASTGGVDAALRDEYLGLIREATGGVAGCRRVMVLRDYHADNLLWLPDRPGLAAVGLLDYQDALVGHPAYDLVSLLEDARRDTTPDLRAAMIERYLSQRPGEDAEAFRQAYCVLGAQRNLKIVGIFARLAVRDGKPRYLAMIPRVWDHLQNDLRHPALAALRAFIRAHVPAPDRRVLEAIAREVVG